MQLGQVRLLPYFIPGDPEIGSAIQDALPASMQPSCSRIIASLYQQTLEAAVYASEELEAASKLAFLTHALEPNALTAEQARDLVGKYNVEWD